MYTVCLCVNQSGTNYNRYMQRLVILHKDPIFSPLDVPQTFLPGTFPTKTIPKHFPNQTSHSQTFSRHTSFKHFPPGHLSVPISVLASGASLFLFTQTYKQMQRETNLHWLLIKETVYNGWPQMLYSAISTVAQACMLPSIFALSTYQTSPDWEIWTLEVCTVHGSGDRQAWPRNWII